MLFSSDQYQRSGYVTWDEGFRAIIKPASPCLPSLNVYKTVVDSESSDARIGLE
jgi:hypothetical protein